MSPSGILANLRSSTRRILPEGRALPDDVWVRRHRAIVALLWLHALGLAGFAVLRGYGLAHALEEGGIVAVAAALAGWRRGGRGLRSVVGALGLVLASAVFVHLSGGVIEVHFHFFVVLAVLTLYQEWRPFLVALGFVVVHHGLVGVLDGPSVYNHYAALNNPVKWAFIHGAFVLAASVANLVPWRQNEEAQMELEASYRQLEESEEKFRSHFAHAAVGQALTRPDGRFAAVNRALCEMTGYSEDELLSTDFLTITHPDDRVASLAQATRLRRGEIDAFDIEKRYLRKGGGIVYGLTSVSVVRDAEGQPRHFTAIIQDITQRKAAEDALLHQAFHDPLTGLPNRALFFDRLGQAVGRRDAGPTAVLFLDLDGFKRVNDSLGHAAGDRVLVAVADRLGAALRSGDTLARFGGDEFVVLCQGLAGEQDALDVAERLAQVFDVPFDLEDHRITLRVSIGIVVAGNHDTPEALLRDADAALYRAKEAGRDRIELFTEEMRSSALARLETESALRRALDRGELEVHYQPLVELDSARVAGVEALVRWRDPERGLIPPGEFIALAEESGLILPLGAMVLGEGCRQVAEWNRAHSERAPLSLWINLSARQLSSPGLTQLVASTLRASGLDPTLLGLEITETALMDDAPGVRARLAGLKELGVSLAVDDFGTGYSSLLYLRRFPVDTLKVDRSFVAGLGHSPEDTAIVTAVVGLAQALGLATVAEGVETADQAAQLAQLGCELAQGYRWSPPLPAEELGPWLEDFRAARPPSEPGPSRVLVVDDERLFRDLLRLNLELAGPFEVVAEAGDGPQAIELARLHQPDLVLLDLAMPAMGGLQALPHILEAAPEAKVAVLSALDRASLTRDDLAGAAGYFEKSSDLDSMVEQLAGLMSRAGT